MSLCPPQIRNGMTRAPVRAAALASRRLTASATARLVQNVSAYLFAFGPLFIATQLLRFLIRIPFVSCEVYVFARQFHN
jgi:hypothetical protein